MADLLRTGNYKAKGYPSRSEAIQALAGAFVNGGYTRKQFQDALLDGRNGTWRWFTQAEGFGKRKAPRNAGHDVPRSWARAQEWVRLHPPVEDRASAKAEIARVRGAVAALSWKGRGGLSDLAVVRAHLKIALKAGKIQYHADVRTVAEEAGLSVGGAHNAQERLRGSGWLRRIQHAQGTQATMWHLQIPATPREHTNTSLGGCDTECSDDVATDLGHDLWGWAQGLGKARGRVWERLPVAPESITTKQLATRLDLDVRTVQGHLAALEKHRLAVEPSGSGWQRGPSSPDEVARQLGVAGAREWKASRYRLDRKRYRDYLADADGDRHEHGQRRLGDSVRRSEPTPDATKRRGWARPPVGNMDPTC